MSSALRFICMMTCRALLLILRGHFLSDVVMLYSPHDVNIYKITLKRFMSTLCCYLQGFMPILFLPGKLYCNNLCLHYFLLKTTFYLHLTCYLQDYVVKIYTLIKLLPARLYCNAFISIIFCLLDCIATFSVLNTSYSSVMLQRFIFTLRIIYNIMS